MAVFQSGRPLSASSKILLTTPPIQPCFPVKSAIKSTASRTPSGPAASPIRSKSSSRSPISCSCDVSMSFRNSKKPASPRVRKDLRALIKLIEKVARRPVFTDFLDQLGDEVEIDLAPFTPGFDYQRFQNKARQFLREHENIPAIRKIRFLEPLTPADLSDIERLLVSEGIGTERDLAHARLMNDGLGLFLRSLVGLDHRRQKARSTSSLRGARRQPTRSSF